MHSFYFIIILFSSFDSALIWTVYINFILYLLLFGHSADTHCVVTQLLQVHVISDARCNLLKDTEVECRHTPTWLTTHLNNTHTHTHLVSASTRSFLKAVCKVSSSSFSPASMAGGVSTVHPPSCSHTHTHTHTHTKVRSYCYCSLTVDHWACCRPNCQVLHPEKLFLRIDQLSQAGH